MIFSNNFY